MDHSNKGLTEEARMQSWFLRKHTHSTSTNIKFLASGKSRVITTQVALFSTALTQLKVEVVKYESTQASRSLLKSLFLKSHTRLGVLEMIKLRFPFSWARSTEESRGQFLSLGRFLTRMSTFVVTPWLLKNLLK